MASSTPAISVLSAVGAHTGDRCVHAIRHPVTVGLVALLFAIQHRGSGKLGAFSVPIMLVWFAALALLGLRCDQTPGVLLAANPLAAAGF